MKDSSRLKELSDRVKKLLPNHDDNPNYQDVIDFSLDKVINDVAAYINFPVDEIPIELDTAIVSMCLQLIDSHNWLSSQTQAGNVQSITEGDVAVTFRTIGAVYGDLQKTNPISDDYINLLNRFRRLPR